MVAWLFVVVKARGPLTFEKHAPMWTLGVGGRPLEVALGGDVARLEEEVRSRRRGGAEGEDRPFSLKKKQCQYPSKVK